MFNVFVVETIRISVMVSIVFFSRDCYVFVCFSHLVRGCFPLHLVHLLGRKTYINHDGGENSFGSQPAGTLSAVTPKL